jgi:hypothetical protein
MMRLLRFALTAMERSSSRMAGTSTVSEKAENDQCRRKEQSITEGRCDRQHALSCKAILNLYILKGIRAVSGKASFGFLAISGFNTSLAQGN